MGILIDDIFLISEYARYEYNVTRTQPSQEKDHSHQALSLLRALLATHVKHWSGINPLVIMVVK